MSAATWWRPALWTTATTGAGLLLWTAISAALLHGRTGAEALRPQLWALGAGMALSATALPLLWSAAVSGAARQRALLATALAMLGAMVLLFLKNTAATDPAWVSAVAMVTVLASLLAIVALPSALAHRQPALRMPVQLAKAMLTGAALLIALIALAWHGGMPPTAPAPTLLLLAPILGLLLALLWRERGGLLPFPAQRPRWLALALLVGVPVLLALCAFVLPALARTLWLLAAASILAGSVAEHRLALDDAVR